MMRAFRWMQTAEAARARATKQGYAPLTEQLASETVSALASVTCDGQELLAGVFKTHDPLTFLTKIYFSRVITATSRRWI
jgi:hypothetical protein